MVNANENKWEPVDYVDLRRGDDVRLTHGGGTVLYGRVLDGAIEVLATHTTSDLSWWRALGFSVERAVPERTLPTEPGIYVEANHYPANGYVLYSLHEAGHWAHDGGGTRWHRSEDEGELPDDLVRLVPVTEVEALQKRAEHVHDILDDSMIWLSGASLPAVRTKIRAALDGKA